MEAKELRIGNYYDGVRGIEQLTNAESLQEIESYPEKFKPIPLTEEWLLKFGLEFEDDLSQFIKVLGYDFGEFILHPLVRGGYLFSEGSIDKYIEHVHQLQNLYFALTGEELTCE